MTTAPMSDVCKNPECEDGQVPDPNACWKPCPVCTGQRPAAVSELDAVLGYLKSAGELKYADIVYYAMAELQRRRDEQRGECAHDARVSELERRIEGMEKDAMRYRALRSEEWATDPRYYQFWKEFDAKLCRLERMDALVDKWIASVPELDPARWDNCAEFTKDVRIEDGIWPPQGEKERE